MTRELTVGTGPGRDDAGERRSGLVVRAGVGVLRAYQWAAAGRPSPCRYVPTCSQYAREALERHGAVRGLWLATRRVLRCHPWAGWGADPVPPARLPAGHQAAGR